MALKKYKLRDFDALKELKMPTRYIEIYYITNGRLIREQMIEPINNLIL